MPEGVTTLRLENDIFMTSITFYKKEGYPKKKEERMGGA
jgi:type III secretory pathway lipoprotein EscJ